MEDDLFDASLDQELGALIAGEHGHVQLLHISGSRRSQGHVDGFTYRAG